MLAFRTTGYNGYGVQYSPFFDSRVAVATSANFGLVGNGRLWVLGLTAGGIVAEATFDTQDGLFDLAWSESHENHVAVAAGDGSVKLFDISLKDYPVQSWREHTREVFSVNWSVVDKNAFCTSSWDGTIKLWTPRATKAVATLAPPTPPGCVYAAAFSPHHPSLLASCSSDSIVRLWDPRAGPAPVAAVHAHGGAEVLSLDWNKYRPDVIATAGVDRAIKVWDIRALSAAVAAEVAPLNDMRGHEYAVRRVAWSPHAADTLLSASYDMTARVWRDKSARPDTATLPAARFRALQRTFDRHREFVVACDWSLWGAPGWVCTAGWDEMVYVWDVNA
ncbi:WD40-repeat-containing domain protein [Dipodascopsis tothii]|uniref:WD40-repeat-containing domain protein n=1 Tax=Dipodascopsis tothii TaxID=44089 RepID=UPI0034CFEB67